MKLLLVVGCFLCSTCCMGQTWSEWVRQKKTQIRYLLNQVAANRVFLGSVKDGYRIARYGLDGAALIRGNDTAQHHRYFVSLMHIRESVRQYSKFKDCIVLQLRFQEDLIRFKEMIQTAFETDPSSLEHIRAIVRSFQEILLQSVDQLYEVMSPRYYQMKDVERLKAIDELFQMVQVSFQAFIKTRNDVQVMMQQRNHELLEVELSKKLNKEP